MACPGRRTWPGLAGRWQPLPWRNHPGYPIYGIQYTGTYVLAAGNGSGGHMGAFTLGTGALVWTLQTDGGVQAIAIMNGVLYGGGHFDNVCVGVTDGATSGFHCPTNAAYRHKLLAIDPAPARRTRGTRAPTARSASSR